MTYDCLIQSEDPKIVKKGISKWANSKTGKSADIRTIILDCHISVEISIKRVLLQLLKAGIHQDENSLIFEGKLLEMIQKMSFSQALQLLAPIFKSWYNNVPFLTQEQQIHYENLKNIRKSREAEKYLKEHTQTEDYIAMIEEINITRNLAAHSPGKCPLIKASAIEKDIKSLNQYAFKCMCIGKDLRKLEANLN